ncbi:ABC transporter permease subunit [Rhodococcus spelaei]|uniref:ABC transporter permease subunit n=1 Tax=Rhodococcus spelaei TaxID=2546320 RepID=A0A541BP61_9NOCA|nr:ABC transporter permease subunit [Rhodococcus spelaei]TQF74102.1 ABC transporter permease subunit [Rhodococcus spelaei]
MNTLTASSRAEFLRLRTWPSLWVLLSAWLVLNLTFVYVFNYLTYRSDGGTGFGAAVPRSVLLARMLPGAVPEVLTQGMAMFGGALILTLGALAAGSGYGWGTWKTALTQGPGRLTAIGGTLVALAVVVAALVVVVFAVDLGVSSIVAGAESQPMRLPWVGDSARAIGAGMLILGMWTACGVLIGTLARGPALAVGLGLVWVLVVENLLRGVGAVLDPIRFVTDYLPGTAAGSLAGGLGGAASDAERTPGVLTVLGPGLAAAVLAVYLVVFVVATAVVLRRRDVD